MVAAAVIIPLAVIWLASKRLEFTWRMSWLLVALVVVCASSLAAGTHAMAWVAEGVFGAASGAAHFIGDL